MNWTLSIAEIHHTKAAENGKNVKFQRKKKPKTVYSIIEIFDVTNKTADICQQYIRLQNKKNSLETLLEKIMSRHQWSILSLTIEKKGIILHFLAYSAHHGSNAMHRSLDVSSN